jgi:hypothetical protein
MCGVFFLSICLTGGRELQKDRAENLEGEFHMIRRIVVRKSSSSSKGGKSRLRKATKRKRRQLGEKQKKKMLNDLLTQIKKKIFFLAIPF